MVNDKKRVAGGRDNEESENSDTTPNKRGRRSVTRDETSPKLTPKGKSPKQLGSSHKKSGVGPSKSPTPKKHNITPRKLDSGKSPKEQLGNLRSASKSPGLPKSSMEHRITPKQSDTNTLIGKSPKGPQSNSKTPVGKSPKGPQSNSKTPVGKSPKGPQSNSKTPVGKSPISRPTGTGKSPKEQQSNSKISKSPEEHTISSTPGKLDKPRPTDKSPKEQQVRPMSKTCVVTGKSPNDQNSKSPKDLEDKPTSTTRRRSHLLVSPVPEVQTPTKARATRKLGLSAAIPNLKDTPTQVLTPTRRSRRLSTDLTDAPPPEVSTPTRRSRRLSTDLTDAPPQVGTTTRRSRRLSTDLTDAPPQVSTPTRRSRRLSTDLTDDPPQVQLPIRRSRRMSTDTVDTDPVEVATPTKRARRQSLTTGDAAETQTPTKCSLGISDASDDVKVSKPVLPQIETLARRSRRRSTDLSDSPIPQALTPTRRSRRLSGDLNDLSEVPTPTKRSRRLSSGKQDDEEDTQGSATKPAARRSRRTSGIGLADIIEKPLDVLEEEEEEEEAQGKEASSALIMKGEPLGLEDIAEEAQEKETSSALITKGESLGLEAIAEVDHEIDQDLKLTNILTEEVSGEEKETGSDTECITVEDESESDSSSKGTETADLVESLPVKVAQSRDASKTIDKGQSESAGVLVDEEPDSVTEEVKDQSNCRSKIVEEENDVILIKDNSKGASDGTSKSKAADKDDDVFCISSSENSSIDSPEVLKKVTNTVSSSVEIEEISPSEDISSFSPTKDVSDAQLKMNGSTSLPSEDAVVSSTTNIDEKANDRTDTTNGISDARQDPKEKNNNDTKNAKIRGMPVSGRWWKDEKKRFGSINKVQGVKSSWSVKMKRKQELKDIMALKTSIVEEKKAKKADLRERQRLNTIRREENERKSEIVQVIKDSRKIKKMKKKQLRFIETRDTGLMK